MASLLYRDGDRCQWWGCKSAARLDLFDVYERRLGGYCEAHAYRARAAQERREVGHGHQVWDVLTEGVVNSLTG